MRKKYTVPDRKALEGIRPAYTPDEIEKLVWIGDTINHLDDAPRQHLGREYLRALWRDEATFIAKTHWIRTKIPGRLARMEFNYAQERLHQIIREQQEKNEPVRIIVLKARQLGFSTFIQSWHYEQCDRNENRVALTISYDEASTIEMFNKASMIHDRMWFPRVTRRSSRNLLEFGDDHGSVFHTRTAGNPNAGRGDTYHHLHLSEVPMWDNSSEVLDAVLQAVPSGPDTSVILESTAKGAVGDFYEMWCGAEDGKNGYIPFFAPWFWDPEYSIDFKGNATARRAFARSLSREDKEYMEKHGLTIEKMAWRHHTIRDKLRGSKRRFDQEYPTEPKDAFLTSGTPAFNAAAVADLHHNAAPPLWQGDILLEAG